MDDKGQPTSVKETPLRRGFSLYKYDIRDGRMSNKLIISAYGSHNASVSMFYKGVYTIVEVERWLNQKNAGLTFYLTARNMQLVFDEICQYLLGTTDRNDADIYISGYMGRVSPKFNYGQHIKCDHHIAHAAGAFYQSPYRRSLVFTYDGGGDGGFFNVYLADRNTGIKLLNKFNQDLGFPYMILADYLSDIKREALSIGNLVYAGKLMGLCSYGKVHEEWLPYFEEFYNTFNYTGDSFIGGAEARYKALPELFHALGVADFDIENSSFSGQFAWDIAATTQRAFEIQFFKYAQPYLDQYPELPVALSGGCALNVLLNTLLLEQRKGQVYVPPNTNDCGISVGALLWHLAPDTQVDLTYVGLPIMDDNRFSEYMEDGKFSIISDINAKDIAQFIADGNILGVIQGNSEHGSRALGNRSIICNPISGMKDTLNHKVKNREWYRPFAPIVRVEDVHKYFNFHGTESRHMVFVAEVKDEWKETLPAITHEDGTGRLQTLSRTQNELIYDVITEFEPLAGHAVILNTSFNVNGKPILTRLSDALHILETSKLDAVYYKGNIIFRTGEERTFKKYRKGEKPQPALNESTTVYLSIFDNNLETNIEIYKRQLNSLGTVKNINIEVLCDLMSAKLIASIAGARTSVHTVDNSRHYYAKAINRVFPDLKQTNDFAPFIRLLWVKEAIRNNVFKSKNFISIDASTTTGMNLVSMVENMISNINSELQDDGSSLVSASHEINQHSNFGSSFYSDKYGRVPETVYSGFIIGGQSEDLDWLLTNYEGVMNWYMSLGKNGTEADFLTISMMENFERFRPFFI
jgi:carbamoyltransferase